MGYKEIKKTVTKKIYVAPCIHCGSDNIDLGDCGYSAFNKAYGKCKDCKVGVTFGCGCNISLADIIRVWNDHNDIDTLMEKQQDIIEAGLTEFNRLKDLKKVRTKKT
jgi:hypothetical protein